MRRIPNLKTKGDGEFEVGARRRAVAAGRANRARRQILKNSYFYKLLRLFKILITIRFKFKHDLNISKKYLATKKNILFLKNKKMNSRPDQKI